MSGVENLENKFEKSISFYSSKENNLIKRTEQNQDVDRYDEISEYK